MFSFKGNGFGSKAAMVVLMVVFTAISIMSCSVDLEDNTQSDYKKIDIIQTGDPAIDASAMFMSEEELSAMGLISNKSDEVSTKGNVAAGDNANIFVYGPLHDRRIVRGKKLGISFCRNWASEATYTVYYSFSGTNLNKAATLNGTGYGNLVAFIDVPADAQGFYFIIQGSQGDSYSDGGAPLFLKTYDSIASLQLIGGKLTVNYSGKAIGYHEKLRFGWNNWADVKDYPMYSVNYTIAKYAQPGGYAYVNIDIPSWANYIDFVVSGNTIWDNNNGKDWHYSIRPLVDVRVNDVRAGKKFVSIYYANGSLDCPVAHYGFDGWNNTREDMLCYSYAGQWNYYISVDPASEIMNTVFRDNHGNWENNFGMNWNMDIDLD